MSSVEILQKYNLAIVSLMSVNSIIVAIPALWKIIIPNNQTQNWAEVIKANIIKQCIVRAIPNISMKY